MTAYYNEFEPYAAQWLRNLISAGHIAPGEVDERSITEVEASDLAGFAQCHFFAGIGGWSLALRLAGWPDDRAVWTGSCPCQPFSLAGRQQGAADARHLWPVWFNLIRECRPRAVFGEQVAAAIGQHWLDLVCTDLEAEGYACGPVVLPACGVGASHIRQRLWFVADSTADGRQQGGQDGRRGGGGSGEERRAAGLGLRGTSGRLADDDDDEGRSGQRRAGLPTDRDASQRHDVDGCGEHGGLAHHHHEGLEGRRVLSERGDERAVGAGGVDSFWSDADWLPCSDGKARPVEPGTFPLAHGVPARVGKLRAYGNAIVPQAAAEVIKAFMECRP